MNRAAERAERLAEQHGSDPESALSFFGVHVLEERLSGRLTELFFGDYVVVDLRLPREKRQELLAHALAHKVLHAGNHLAIKRRVYSFGNYHERQAEVFAAYFLIPSSGLEPMISPDLSVYEVAAEFGVSEKFAEFRLKLAKHYQLVKQVSA